MYREDCRDCSYGCDGEYMPVSGCGTIPSDIMFLGSQPDWKSGKNHHFYYGNGEQILFRAIQQLSIEYDDIFKTYAVKCVPVKPDKPKKLHLDACRDYLVAEIKQVQPKVIVAMGKSAIVQLMGAQLPSTKIKSLRGLIFDLQIDGMEEPVKVIPTYDPNAVYYDAGKFDSLQYDIEKAVSLVGNEFTLVDLNKFEHIICESMQQVEWVFRELKRAKKFSFDFETGGLNFLDRELLSVHFCWDKEFGVTIPLEHKDSPFVHSTVRLALSGDRAKDVTKQFLLDNRTKELERIYELMDEVFSPEYYKIAQNGKFDVLFGKHNGLFTKCKHTYYEYDTMLAHYLIDENIPHNLDVLTRDYLDWPEYSSGIGLDDDYGYRFANGDRLYLYGARDAHGTFLLYNLFEELESLKLEEQEYVFNYLLMPFVNALVDVENTGLYVDQEYLQIIKEEYQVRVNELMEQFLNSPNMKSFLRQRGAKSFNVNSAPQLRDYFYNHLEYNLPRGVKLTKGGENPTDQQTLKLMRSQYEKNDEIDTILEYKKLKKILSTYIIGFEKLIWEDGRIHSTFNLHITVTGRTSSTKPNTQNILKRDKDNAKKIKNMFVAPEGHTILSMDLSQAELRVLAIVSGDTTFQNAFKIADKEGKSFHKITASRIFNKPVDQLTAEEVVVTKSIVFGIIYGRTTKAIVAELRAMGTVKNPDRTEGERSQFYTEDDINKILDGVFGEFRGVFKWIEDTKEFAKANGFVTSYFGRKRRLPGLLLEYATNRDAYLEEELLRQAVNSPIQSVAADITLFVLQRLLRVIRENDYPVKVLNLIHDDIMMEVADDFLNEWVGIAKQVIEQKVQGLEFKVGAEFGKRWGSMVEESEWYETN